MKTVTHKPLLQSVFAGLLLAVSVSVSQAAVEFSTGFNDTNTFTRIPGNLFGYNPPVPNFRYDFGSSNTSFFVNNTDVTNVFAWSSNDAGSNANSGSIKVSFNFNTVADGAASAAFTIDLFAFAGTITNASSVSFDIMVDPSSPADVSYNGYGYLEVVARNENYSFTNTGFADNLGNPTYGQNLAGTWEHITVPVGGDTSHIRALTIQDYSGADRNMNGVLTFYLDNLTINSPGVVVPPTNSISKPASKGLHITSTTHTTVDAPQYQRQGIRSVASNLSWYNSASPVTYSITITNYPPLPYTNYITYLLLVPGTPTSVNPDYAENHCVYLDIENRIDGSAELIFRWKVNDGSANDQLYGSGRLGSVTNANILGKWSVTFDNNTNVTLVSPSGNIFATNMPDFDPDVLGGAVTFVNPLVVYAGCQGNSVPNIGQTVVFSSVSVVSNSTALLSDNFTANTLDTSKWQLAAEDPNAIVQVSASVAYLVTWNQPDNGFGFQVSTNLLTGFQSSPLPIYTIGFNRGVLVPNSLVVSNPAAFFRLRSPP